MSSDPKKVEAAIQRALVAWIRENYPSVEILATLNENSRHQIDMGCDVGITDLLIFKPVQNVKHIFYLELKTQTGKLHASQKKWAARYTPYENTHYGVAYGFADAREQIKEWMTQH